MSESNLKSIRQNTLSGLLKIIIPIVVIAILAYAIIHDWQSFVNFPWQIQWKNLVIQIILHSIALSSMTIAWHLIIVTLSAQTKWAANFWIYSVSLLARRIPLAIWFAGSRVLMYRRRNISPRIVLSATGLEILLIFLAGVICYVSLAPWYSFSWEKAWTLIAIPPILLTMGLLLRPNAILTLVNSGLRMLGRNTFQGEINSWNILLWLGLYLFTWFTDGLGLSFLVRGLTDIAPGIVDIIGISSISAMVGMLGLFLPGGLGLKEFTISGLLAPWMPLSAGIAIALAYRVMQTCVEMAWAWCGYLMNKYLLNLQE